MTSHASPRTGEDHFDWSRPLSAGWEIRHCQEPTRVKNITELYKACRKSDDRYGRAKSWDYYSLPDAFFTLPWIISRPYLVGSVYLEGSRLRNGGPCPEE